MNPLCLDKDFELNRQIKPAALTLIKMFFLALCLSHGMPFWLSQMFPNTPLRPPYIFISTAVSTQ